MSSVDRTRLLLACLVVIGLAGLANTTAAYLADNRNSASARALVTQLRQETRDLRELVEHHPTQAQALQQTATIVRLAEAAEHSVDRLHRRADEQSGLRIQLLQSANLAHGELAEADEEVVGAAAAGLEAHIDQLAELTRRQEAYVGPQLAR